MSQMPGGELPFPADFAQFKTVFYQEGQKAAILVVRRRGRRSQRTLPLASAEAALAYCRRTAAALLYVPSKN